MKENFSFIELSYCMLIQTLVKKLKFAMHKELMSKKPYTQLSVTLESLLCVLTHITLENQKKSLEIILDVRKIYFSRSTGKFLFRLIRGIKNSGSSGT